MQDYIVESKKTIRDCLFKLEKNKQKCLIVVNTSKKIIGTVTDGDIRRALLKKNVSLETKIINYVAKKFFSIKTNSSSISNIEINKKIKNLIEDIKDDHIDIIPVINSNNQILKIIFTKDFKKNIYNKSNLLAETPVLIMAGGRGSRLKQFTNYFPKPLVPFKDTTAVEYIINNFKNFGIKEIFMSVHYKKNLIKSYLRENKVKNINFIEEKQPMGTAGAIGLLKGKDQNDFFLVNCDSILSINLEKFYEFHKKNNFQITLVAASKNFKISYGTCKINKNGQLKQINEKPNLNYLVSVGLYLMKPEIIKKISVKNVLGMDDLIKKVKKKGGKIGVFPISENDWFDTGTKENETIIL